MVTAISAVILSACASEVIGGKGPMDAGKVDHVIQRAKGGSSHHNRELLAGLHEL